MGHQTLEHSLGHSWSFANYFKQLYVQSEITLIQLNGYWGEEKKKKNQPTLVKHFSVVEIRIATYSPVSSSPAWSSYYQYKILVEAKGNISIRYRRAWYECSLGGIHIVLLRAPLLGNALVRDFSGISSFQSRQQE